MNETDLARIEQLLDAPSLYPDAPRKSREQRKQELLDWYEAYDEVHGEYNLFGMDRVDADPPDTWLDNNIFRKQRYQVQSRFIPPNTDLAYNFTLIMRSKHVFDMFCQYVLGKRECYARSIAMFVGDRFYENSFEQGLVPMPFAEYVAARPEGKRLVFKRSFGSNGDGVIIARIAEGKVEAEGETLSADEFAAKICDGDATWLVQEFIVQSDFMNMLNESSVNTLRITTYHTGARCFVDDSTVIRYGKPGAVTDNIERPDGGGYYSSIDENGCIGPLAFDLMEKTCHPSPFAGMEVPGVREAEQLAVELHTHVPELFSVGWDVALGPNGPIVIEGNDGWGLALTQTPFNQGRRKVWDTYLAERQAYFASIER